ncbi:hypothetical protein HDU76_003195 [Blyttiomyces sp. JEL0837]|nr:hypothetical protein HDU76_003195 [Blyttiomyces sp. JEL0837]
MTLSQSQQTVIVTGITPAQQPQEQHSQSQLHQTVNNDGNVVHNTQVNDEEDHGVGSSSTAGRTRASLSLSTSQHSQSLDPPALPPSFVWDPVPRRQEVLEQQDREREQEQEMTDQIPEERPERENADNTNDHPRHPLPPRPPQSQSRQRQRRQSPPRDNRRRVITPLPPMQIPRPSPRRAGGVRGNNGNLNRQPPPPPPNGRVSVFNRLGPIPLERLHRKGPLMGKESLENVLTEVLTAYAGISDFGGDMGSGNRIVIGNGMSPNKRRRGGKGRTRRGAGGGPVAQNFGNDDEDDIGNGTGFDVPGSPRSNARRGEEEDDKVLRNVIGGGGIASARARNRKRRGLAKLRNVARNVGGLGGVVDSVQAIGNAVVNQGPGPKPRRPRQRQRRKVVVVGGKRKVLMRGAGKKGKKGKGKWVVLTGEMLDRELDMYMLEDKNYAAAKLDSELDEYIKARDEADALLAGADSIMMTNIGEDGVIVV